MCYFHKWLITESAWFTQQSRFDFHFRSIGEWGWYFWDIWIFGGSFLGRTKERRTREGRGEWGGNANKSWNQSVYCGVVRFPDTLVSWGTWLLWRGNIRGNRRKFSSKRFKGSQSKWFTCPGKSPKWNSCFELDKGKQRVGRQDCQECDKCPSFHV